MPGPILREYWTGNRAFWLVDFSYWPSDCLSRVIIIVIEPSFEHYFFMNIMWTADIHFTPFTGTMNSTNWPAPNVWVFIAQLVEHCSTNPEGMGSNPVEAPKTFFGLNCDCLNRNHNCDDHTFTSFCFIAAYTKRVEIKPCSNDFEHNNNYWKQLQVFANF